MNYQYLQDDTLGGPCAIEKGREAEGRAMSNSVDEVTHDLRRLTDHAKDAGDYPEFFDGLHDRIRSTLTAQAQEHNMGYDD